MTKRTHDIWGKEMAQWSRALVLTEAPGSMPNTHMVADQPSITLALGGSNAPPGFLLLIIIVIFIPL